LLSTGLKLERDANGFILLTSDSSYTDTKYFICDEMSPLEAELLLQHGRIYKSRVSEKWRFDFIGDMVNAYFFFLIL
jgi:hypothetical protein